jgi:hypothetical protein
MTFTLLFLPVKIMFISHNTKSVVPTASNVPPYITDTLTESSSHTNANKTAKFMMGQGENILQ